jgi:hypothetical protein
MRCCLATLDEEMLKIDVLPPEGTVIKCRYHTDDLGMILRDGAWHWNRPHAK